MKSPTERSASLQGCAPHAPQRPYKPCPSQGVVLYRGPSLLTGEPILAVLTGLRTPSGNVKTGPMAQLYIFPAAASPHDTVKAAKDASVCGECPLRWSLGGGCYVVPHHLTGLWRAATTHYPDVAASDAARLLGDTPLRIGAYGDPGAVPVAVIAALMPRRKHPHSGYTHQWRRPDAQRYRHILMASVTDAESEREAWAMGWRTFRAVREDDVPAADTLECPYTTHGINCSECRLCDGARVNGTKQPKSIWVRAHGSRRARLPVVQ